MPQKIRWVLAHEPIELFLRAAKKFKATMVRTLSIPPLSLFLLRSLALVLYGGVHDNSERKRLSNGSQEASAPGELEYEIMTLSEYSERYQGGKTVTKHDLLDLMEAGEIEMSQMYTSTLGRKHNQDLWALDLPFLFRDHGHAAQVLEGPVGQKLMDDMAAKTNIKGLAFTYSGGYRMIPAQVALRTIESFEGKRIRCNKSPIAAETMIAVGAEPVQIELEQINEAMQVSPRERSERGRESERARGGGGGGGGTE
eukprot:COSAG06_NODE_13268_length_1275_cov_2.482143_1_plen_255_part_00